jgi:hypothetical protein
VYINVWSARQVQKKKSFRKGSGDNSLHRDRIRVFLPIIGKGKLPDAGFQIGKIACDQFP